MALPTFVASGNPSGVRNDTCSPSMPTGATTDDLLILHIENTGADETVPDPPTGGAWTLVGSVVTTTGPAATQHTIYWAPYDAGINLDMDATLNEDNVPNHLLAIVSAWRGVDLTTPIHKSQSGSSDAADQTFSMAGVTTTVDDCLIVVSATTGDRMTVSGWTNASLSDVTEVIDVDTASGNDGSIHVAHGGLATAGASGTTTATPDTAGLHEAYWTLALLPAGAAATPFTGLIIGSPAP